MFIHKIMMCLSSRYRRAIQEVDKAKKLLTVLVVTDSLTVADNRRR